MKKALSLLLAAILVCMMLPASFAAKDTYYNNTKIKCGYYVSNDGTIGMLVESSKIVVFDLYDSDHSKFYKTTKDALKSEIVTVSKEKASVSKGNNDFKKLRVTIDSKGNVKVLAKTSGYSDSDAFKVHYAGTTYSKAIELAEKKLDDDFS